MTGAIKVLVVDDSPTMRQIVTRILEEAAEHLTEGGGLMCEIGQARAAIEAMFPELPFVWLDTTGSQSEVFWITREGLGAL